MLLLGTTSVSPWTTSMRSMGTPRRSAASIFQVVTWPWPYGRGAGDHPEPAVGEQLDRAELAAPTGRGDLHVGGQPDAQQAPFALRTATRLLGPQLLVPGGLEGHLEAAAVVAHVVDGADGGGVREGVGGDEVAAPDLRRVHADLGGEQVDGALEARRRLGPAGTPVGGGRGRVGDDRPPRHRHVRDGVDAGGHHLGHRRQEHAHHRVGADVLHDVEAVVGDPAVAGAADGDVEHLGPAVGESHHRRAAVLGPAARGGRPAGTAPRGARPRGRACPWRRSRRRRRGRSRGPSRAEARGTRRTSAGRRGGPGRRSAGRGGRPPTRRPRRAARGGRAPRAG